MKLETRVGRDSTVGLKDKRWMEDLSNNGRCKKKRKKKYKNDSIERTVDDMSTETY